VDHVYESFSGPRDHLLGLGEHYALWRLKRRDHVETGVNDYVHEGAGNGCISAEAGTITRNDDPMPGRNRKDPARQRA
jgi:hypothetical protein